MTKADTFFRMTYVMMILIIAFLLIDRFRTTDAPKTDASDVLVVGSGQKITKFYYPVELKDSISDPVKVDRKLIILRRPDTGFLIASDDVSIDLNMLNGRIDISFPTFRGKPGMRTYNIVSSGFGVDGVRLIDYITGLKSDPDPVSGEGPVVIFKDQGWNFSFKPDSVMK